MEKVRALQNMAYKLGIDEGECIIMVVYWLLINNQDNSCVNDDQTSVFDTLNSFI